MYTLLLGLLLTQVSLANPASPARQAATQSAEDRIVAAVTSLLQAGQTERAVTLLQPFVKANPKARRAAVLLSFAYVRQGKYEQARIMSEQLATELPRDYYTQHVLGLSLFGLNRYDEAEAHFKRALELKPDFGEAVMQLGLLHLGKGSFEDARTSFQRMLELGYRPNEAHKNLGSILIKQGRYPEAINELTAALKVDPNSASTYFLLADALRKSGNAEAAGEAMKRFQALNDVETDQRVRFAKAQAFYEQGMQLMFGKNQEFLSANFTAARNAFTQAVETLPQLDGGFYRLAQIDYLRNNYDSALQNIRLALNLNPNEAEYYFVLASCLKDRDLTTALTAAAKAISINPNVADFHNLRGILLAKAGDDAHAIESFRRATELAPQDESFRMNLSATERKLLKKPPPDSF